MTKGRAALAGAASGAWLGLFIGLLFGLFGRRGVAHASRKRAYRHVLGSRVRFRRPLGDGRPPRLASIKTLQAQRYSVQVDAGYAAEATRVLGRS